MCQATSEALAATPDETTLADARVDESSLTPLESRSPIANIELGGRGPLPFLGICYGYGSEFETFVP